MNYLLNILRAADCCGEITDDPCVCGHDWTVSTLLFACGPSYDVTGSNDHLFVDVLPCRSSPQKNASVVLEKTFGPYAEDKTITLDIDWTIAAFAANPDPPTGVALINVDFDGFLADLEIDVEQGSDSGSTSRDFLLPAGQDVDITILSEAFNSTTTYDFEFEVTVVTAP